MTLRVRVCVCHTRVRRVVYPADLCRTVEEAYQKGNVDKVRGCHT